MRKYEVIEYEMEDYNKAYNDLTYDDVISGLAVIKRGYIPDYNFTGDECDFENHKWHSIMSKAMSYIELFKHLKDRPCSVCEFHKENGCCKWECVFDEVLK